MACWSLTCCGLVTPERTLFRCFHANHSHDDIIKWRHFPRYCPFLRGIHRSLLNSPHKGQWALMFSLICTWINGWVNNCDAGNLRHHRTHYDVTVMHFIYFKLGRCFHCGTPVDWLTASHILLNPHQFLPSDSLRFFCVFPGKPLTGLI